MDFQNVMSAAVYGWPGLSGSDGSKSSIRLITGDYRPLLQILQ